MAERLFISSFDMNANNRQLLFSAIIVSASLVLIDIIVGKVGDYAMARIPNFPQSNRKR